MEQFLRLQSLFYLETELNTCDYLTNKDELEGYDISPTFASQRRAKIVVQSDNVCFHTYYYTLLLALVKEKKMKTANAMRIHLKLN